MNRPNIPFRRILSKVKKQNPYRPMHHHHHHHVDEENQIVTPLHDLSLDVNADDSTNNNNISNDIVLNHSNHNNNDSIAATNSSVLLLDSKDHEQQLVSFDDKKCNGSNDTPIIDIPMNGDGSCNRLNIVCSDNNLKKIPATIQIPVDISEQMSIKSSSSSKVTTTVVKKKSSNPSISTTLFSSINNNNYYFYNTNIKRQYRTSKKRRRRSSCTKKYFYEGRYVTLGIVLQSFPTNREHLLYNDVSYPPILYYSDATLYTIPEDSDCTCMVGKYGIVTIYQPW